MLFEPHILFPVDFSERSKAARQHVISMAQHFHAKLTLLHVIQVPVGWYGGTEQAFPIMFDMPAMVADGRQQLEAFLETPNPVLHVETVVDHGDPATCIVDYAESRGAGLIMMPTYGCGKFRGLLLGSVTAKVLHDAKCAVWTFAHTEGADGVEPSGYRTILCAAGLEPENTGVICYAANLARSFKAQLRLVHAVSPVELGIEDYLDTGFHESLMHLSRERLVALQHEAGAEAEIDLEVGRVPSVVRKAALEHHADLVVIGRGRLQGTLGRLRTNTYGIIRDSPCPVLSA